MWTSFILLPGHPWVPSTNFSPFGPAVWPAIANIFIQTHIYIYIYTYIKRILTTEDRHDRHETYMSDENY